MTKEEWNDYQRKYKKLKCKQICLWFRLGSYDDVLIEHLNRQENKTSYIKTLIRKDLENAKAGEC